jgi:uncharacterized protein YndB with AHSA1/START domain
MGNLASAAILAVNPHTVSDWKKGSPLLWQMNQGGKPFIAVKGIITDIQPGKFLAYTTIDPNSGIADIPENYLTVTYDLSSENGQTFLTVTQGDYSKVGEGEKRYKETVSPHHVRDFRGAMQGRGEKGLIITTGRFTKEAKTEANRDGVTPIELIDGDRLVELFEKHHLGLKPVIVFEIDHEFFKGFN